MSSPPKKSEQFGHADGVDHIYHSDNTTETKLSKQLSISPLRPRISPSRVDMSSIKKSCINLKACVSELPELLIKQPAASIIPKLDEERKSSIEIYSLNTMRYTTTEINEIANILNALANIPEANVMIHCFNFDNDFKVKICEICGNSNASFLVDGDIATRDYCCFIENTLEYYEISMIVENLHRTSKIYRNLNLKRHSF